MDRGGEMTIKTLADHAKPKKGPLSSMDLIRNSFMFRKLLGEDRRTLFEHARATSERVLAPDTCKLHTGEVKLEAKLPDLKDLRAVGIPAEYGGSAEFGGIVDSVIVHENLAYGSASAAAFFDGNGLFATPLILAGSEEQKQRYLPALARDEMVGCYGLTDVECGSDVANMRTLAFAEREDRYVLNGTKTFVTNAPVAQHAIVFAKERGNETRYRNIAAFVVPAKTGAGNGFVSGKPMDKLGWRASHTSEIAMEEVNVSAGAMIGGKQDGFLIAVTTLAYGRLKIAAEALGLMERALDETIKFVRERTGVGGPLKNQPLVQAQIAEMVQLVQATRDTLYNTALLAEEADSEGKILNVAVEAANVKSFAGAALQRVVNIALPLHGGYGFTLEMPISVIHSDAPLYMIGEGADNVLRIATGASVLGK